MVPKNRVPPHPGEVLLQNFLHPMEIPQIALAKHLGISMQRVNELVRGKRGMTPETAWLLSEAFGNKPEFWMNLQTVYDLARNRPKRRVTPLPNAKS